METKKTLAQLAENPDEWTKQDIEDVKKMNEAFLQLKKAVEPYAINKKYINTEIIYLNYYKEYTIISAIFETFIENDSIYFKDLIQSIHNNATNSLFYELTNSDIRKALKKMIRLGYITTISAENKYNPIFGITDLGIESNRQQTIQNIAVTSFTNYQTFKLSQRAEKMNVVMLIVTIISLVVAACSIYVTIKVSN